VTARSAGLSLLETQALSALVFAGSAQLSAVGLFATGAAGAEIVLTTLLLNIRHLLYGVSLGRRYHLSPRERPIAAFFLTDEAFGVASASRESSFRFLLGIELSLFVVWNLATLGGFLLGTAIPDPEKVGVDLIFPIAFLAILVPLIRTRVELVVALCSGALAFGLDRVLPGGLPVLLTGVAGSLLGAYLTRGTPPDRSIDLEDAAREVA
jgi:4-azaleucine resistance transporter AzlC